MAAAVDTARCGSAADWVARVATRPAATHPAAPTGEPAHECVELTPLMKSVRPPKSKEEEAVTCTAPFARPNA